MVMEQSILKSVKQMLGGISSDNTMFDPQLILFINSVLGELTTLGAFSECPEITSDSELWDDLDIKEVTLALVKPFVFLKVKMMFDTPTGGAKDALEALISEYQWRIMVASESDTL